MKPDLLQLAAELARRGEPFALATVVNRQPPISAQVGDVALVTQAGEFHGWVGGTCTRPTVIAEAARFDLRWLAEEQALLAMPLVPLHAEGECDEIAAPPPRREQDASPGSQKPFQNLRDLLEK